MKKKNVLIVDDERNIRLTIQRTLEPLDIETDEAANGEEALSLLSKKTYDLIFLDIKMPGINGMDVLRDIRRKGLQAKVLVITAHGNIENAVEAMKLGAVDFIQKPFSPERIRKIVAGAVRRGDGFLHKLLPVRGEDRRRFHEVISDEELMRLKSETGVTSEEDYEFCMEQSKAAVEKTDFDSAEAWAQKAIALNPVSAQAFNFIGVFCELRHDRFQAQKYYRAAMALEPSCKPAWNNLERSTKPGARGKFDLGYEDNKTKKTSKSLSLWNRFKDSGKEDT